ncbi:MAG: hypothetical protein ACR2NN_05180 [Bryobacteraceae bacterium]
MRKTYTLEYWRDGDWLVGRLRDVPGVFSQGATSNQPPKAMGMWNML